MVAKIRAGAWKVSKRRAPSQKQSRQSLIRRPCQRIRTATFVVNVSGFPNF